MQMCKSSLYSKKAQASISRSGSFRTHLLQGFFLLFHQIKLILSTQPLGGFQFYYPRSCLVEHDSGCDSKDYLY